MISWPFVVPPFLTVICKSRHYYPPFVWDREPKAARQSRGSLPGDLRQSDTADMKELSADIPAPVRSECHRFWIRQRVRRPVSCCPLANKCCFTSPWPSKIVIAIIFSPLQNLVRLGSKALLKLNSSAKTRARVANQKQWDINQQLKDYYLLAVSNIVWYVFKMCTIFPNSQWPKCSLIDVRLHSKPDAGNVTLGCQ